MDPNRSKHDMARYQQPARGGYNRPGSGNRLPANEDCGCSGSMNHSDSVNYGRRGSMNGSMEKIDQYPIAMAYVPWQKYGDTFDLENGFRIGTIFPELNLPFMRAGCAKK